MHQLRFDSGVRTHGECQLPLWPSQPSGTLNQFAPHGAQLFKVPQQCAHFGGIAFFFKANYLHFPVEIVRQYGRERKGLVADSCTIGHIVYLHLRLEFGEYAFLNTLAVMEDECSFGRHALVGNDDLEVVTVLAGNRQVQLDRALVLFSVLTTDKYEAVALILGSKLPVRLQKAIFPIDTTPALPVLDQCL